MTPLGTAVVKEPVSATRMTKEGSVSATFMTPFAVFKNECSYNCTSCVLLNILLKNLISYYTRDKQFINDERLQKGA